MARTTILPSDPLAQKVWQAKADCTLNVVAHAVYGYAGVYLEHRGGNVATPRLRPNCINCGAAHKPDEPVCSYCGTRA